MCPGAPDDATPCMECPLAYLDGVLESPMGAQLRNIVDLDFAVSARFAVDLDHVPYDDFRMLRALHEEREAYRAEASLEQ
jgi:hypothetical protein